jgi:hypothetical protein
MRSECPRVTNGREEGKKGDFLESYRVDFLPLRARSIQVGAPDEVLIVFLQYQIRIHMVINVIYTQAPDSLPPVVLPVKIEAQVQSMAGRQAVVVPGGYQVSITGRVERRHHHNPPFR